MESRFSSFSSTSTYSHLLYLNDYDRACYLSGPISPGTRHESLSFFSTTTSRSSSESERSEFSEILTEHTGNSSLHSSTFPSQRFAEHHYPLITSLDSFRSLAGDVPRTHFAFTIARHTIAIHNTIIRAFNSAYNHALGIKSATSRCTDFLRFNQVMIQMLDRHHEVENTVLFPAFEQLLEQPGLMEETIKQRHRFMPGLEAFKQYVFNERAAESFNGVQFRKIVESFAPDLIQQLHDEIPLLVSLRVTDSKKIRRVWRRAEKETKRKLDPYICGPFVLGCQDRTFLLDGERISDFPGMPWFLEVLVRRWHAKKHVGMWEFLPSDLYGTRRSITI